MTVHRAQGSTVDTAHAILHSSSMNAGELLRRDDPRPHSNIAYVVTAQAHLEEHQQDDAPTAKSILRAVVAHEGAEKSGHETIAAERAAWTSIAHLADHYETIAQTAQAEQAAALLAGAGLTPEQLDEAIASESYGSLVAEVRQVRANGNRPRRF